MPGKNRALGVALALLGAAFLYGAVQLFLLRFASGDVYPAYSSFRADPLGTMALYESLSNLPNATSQRNVRPVALLDGRGGAIFFTGANPAMLMSGKQLDTFESLMKGGTRLVIVFSPVGPPVSQEQKDKPTTPLPPPAIERWGVHLAIAEKSETLDDDDDEPEPSPRETSLYFADPDANWRVLRQDWGKPTAIMRALGAGSIALVANGYLLSNEALLEQRDSQLIAKLIDGVAPHYTFEESHFGIQETGSIVALARKYNLHGVAAALALLAILFIWANSSSFLPATEAIEQEAMGRSATSGFVNLLRRGIPPRSLLGACAEEWRKSARLGVHHPDERRKRVEVAAKSGREPLETYREISRILAERKTG